MNESGCKDGTGMARRNQNEEDSPWLNAFSCTERCSFRR
jgi:hypothetical protein